MKRQYREYFRATLENLKMSTENPYAGTSGLCGALWNKKRDKYYSYERFSEEIDAILQYLIDHQIALEVQHRRTSDARIYQPASGCDPQIPGTGRKIDHDRFRRHVPRIWDTDLDRLPALLSGLRISITYAVIYQTVENPDIQNKFWACKYLKLML